jgi:hypothetical protein
MANNFFYGIPYKYRGKIREMACRLFARDISYLTKRKQTIIDGFNKKTNHLGLSYIYLNGFHYKDFVNGYEPYIETDKYFGEREFNKGYLAKVFTVAKQIEIFALTCCILAKIDNCDLQKWFKSNTMKRKD